MELEKLPGTKETAERIGPYYSGIAAYVGAALAMVIGSLLKPNRAQHAAAAAEPPGGPS